MKKRRKQKITKCYLLSDMYQFFVEEPLEQGKIIHLRKDQEHHAKKVLRLHDETVRLVHDGKAFFGHCMNQKDDFYIEVLTQDETMKEYPVNITLLLSVIRKEKFEFVLQKASELGVNQIIPVVTSRCTVLPKEEKADKQLMRYQSILEESSAQCKRNIIPTITKAISMKEVENYTSDLNFVAYENEEDHTSFYSKLEKKDITLFVGPEGGFSLEEIRALEKMGFVSVSLGTRILRAETASIYLLSIINDWMMNA